MRSQKVGGFDGGRLAEILHPSGTLGVFGGHTTSVSAMFYRPEKRGCGLSKGAVAPSLTQITPSAAEPTSPQIHPPPPPASVLIYLWWNSAGSFPDLH